MRTSQLSSAPRSSASAPSAPSSWDKGPSCPPPLRSTARPTSPQVSHCTRLCLCQVHARSVFLFFGENALEMFAKYASFASACHLPPAPHTPLNGCWGRVSSALQADWLLPLALQVCRDNRGYSKMEMLAFSLSCFSAASPSLFLTVVDKAAVIIFCYFTPPTRRSAQYNLYISKMYLGSHWAEHGPRWFTFCSCGFCCR